MPDETDVLERLVRWGRAQPAIRALILTSSRTRPDRSADELSDYDVVVAVRDASAFAAEDSWASEYGPPLVRWRDENQLHGITTYFRGVVYADGVRVDYTIWPDTLLERVAADPVLPNGLDVGYRVLLDKDGRTAGWAPPTYRAHIPAPPTEAEYRALVDEFWWDAIVVAKSLRRGELVFAKWALDHDAKFVALRQFLEWRIEIDHDWSLKPGAYGRGLEGLLPRNTWSELERTYVGMDSEDNWNALFRTVALFRRVAAEVGDALGHAYDEDLDAAVSRHLEALRTS